MAFNVQNRPAFEIPYTEITNTNLAGKNEVAVEFSLGPNVDQPGKGKRAGAGVDQLVEMRLYIPGVTTKKEALEGEDAPSDAEGEEEQNAANLFYDTLMDKAEIGEVAGDTFATFLDVLHLTPRYASEVLPSLAIFTNIEQRTFRYRYVREFLPIARQNIRLQDSVRAHQEIYVSAKAR